MNDIQQWRRMIQPSRARTSAVEHDDAEGISLPITPKRGLKPKFSSYFTHNGNRLKTEPSSASPADDPFLPHLPTWPAHQESPQLGADQLLDTVICRLLSDPYRSLDSRFNGAILYIFEAYQNLREEKERLECRVASEVFGRKSLVHRLQEAQKLWSEERQDYKDEIKRLELLIARGRGGLAEVTLARQGSGFRARESIRRSQQLDPGLQTVLEAIDRTNRQAEKTWSNQRAVFRTKRVQSPSAEMRRLSEQLSASTPETELLFDRASVLSRAGCRDAADVARRAVPDTPAMALNRRMLSPATEGYAKMSLSDNTSSTFSCAGDLLPDENVAIVHAHPAPMTATTMLPPGRCREPQEGVAADESVARTTGPVSQTTHEEVKRSSVTAMVQKNPSLIAKASSFWQRLIPHHDTIARFSFEPGDDCTGPSPARATTAFDQRTSASAGSRLSQPEEADVGVNDLPSAAQSPVSPATYSNEPKASRIPTPTYYSASCAARARREGEACASMLPARPTSTTPCPRNNVPTFPQHSSRVPMKPVGGATSMNASSLQGLSQSIVQGNAFASALVRSQTYPDQYATVWPSQKLAATNGLNGDLHEAENLSKMENRQPYLDDARRDAFAFDLTP